MSEVNVQVSFKTVGGQLYLVPTPIGNLADMTYRAVEVLKMADLLLAEDTRHTGRLLQYYGIETPMLSYEAHQHNKRIERILGALAEGKIIAQVSDAGMPSISDPGSALVSAVLAAGYPVIPLPGASASLTGLIASGLDPSHFCFVGFLPKKAKAQRDRLMTWAEQGGTLIFYESPYRLVETLANMMAVFGGDRPACVVREMTKAHESFYRGTLAALHGYFDNQERIKGEIAIYVAGNRLDGSMSEAVDVPELPLAQQVLGKMLEEGLDEKAAIKAVAKVRHIPKQAVYMAYHEAKQSGEIDDGIKASLSHKEVGDAPCSST